MKDYEEMSDFEINKRVFKVIVGAKPLGYPHNADGRSVGNEANGNYRWYDYCNNPADAWPIIDENNITIINDIRLCDWLLMMCQGTTMDLVASLPVLMKTDSAPP